LLAEKCGTREQKDALARVLRLPVILHTEGVRKRKDIGEFRAVADGDLAAAEDGVPMCGQYSSGSALSSQNASHPCASSLPGRCSQ
jgi:hypothetical protein